MDYILSKLPEEFHDECKKSIKASKDVAPMSDDEVKAAVLAALPFDVPDAVKASFEDNPNLAKPAPAPSREEQKAMVLEKLSDEHKADFEKNWENEIL